MMEGENRLMAIEKSKKKKLLRNNEYYDIQMIFDNLYERSKQGEIFKNLHNLIINRNNILLAYRNIKRNKGSKTKGVNNTTIIEIAEQNIDILVEYVRNRLEYYQPHKVKRVEIPKHNGKTRPLGIPTMEDRIVQQCIKQVLEPICEAKFHNHSYGFRPNRSTEHAIARSMFLMQRSGFRYVVDIDIKGFFDNVNHGKLLKQLWTIGIRDKKVLKIISSILKAEIENIGVPTKGTPQGGIISPLLSNVVLNELDWWISNQWETFETQYKYTERTHKYRAIKNSSLKEIFMVRYADDQKIFCKDHKTAWKIFYATKLWLKERLHLEISNEKSKVVNLNRNYSEFLGIKLKLRKKGKKNVCKSHISDKSKKNIKKEIKRKISLMKKNPNTSNVNKYNSTILGMQNYYNKATRCSIDFAEISFLVSKYLYNQLKSVGGSSGTKSKAFIKFYKDYNRKTVYVNNIALFPIPSTKTKNALCFNQDICNYSADGRNEIHSNLKGINIEITRYLLNNPIINMSVEYNDNRISRYVGQNGKCGITGKVLEIGNIECHHIKPKELGGSDEYNNLIFVNYHVHKVIHATEIDTINKYLKNLNLDEEQVEKLNELRKKSGNKIIAYANGTERIT